MHDADRRAFLKKLAATTVYAAPVVRTLAAPDPAAGQALSKKGGGNGGGKGMGKGKGDWAMNMEMGKSDWAMNMGFDRTFPDAPWSRDD